MLLPRTRQEAIEQGHLYYFTGEPCKYGHLAKRVVRNWGCYECGQIATKRWNKEDHRKNPIKYSIRNKKWADKNRQRTVEQARKWRRDNPEKAKAIDKRPHRRAKKKQWARDNAAYFAVRASERRAAIRYRVPAWANQKKIDRIYQLAAWGSKASGLRLEVDHVIPLQGELISGLHIETNMQILTKEENIRKFNHWEQ